MKKKRAFLFLLILPAALFSSCMNYKFPVGEGDPERGVEFTYFGHSAFGLVDSLGRTLVIDPYDDTVGYGLFSQRADALLVSHGHFDHNFLKGVRAKRRDMDLVNSTGTQTVAGDLTIFGVEADHDSHGGAIHGKTRIFIFRLGGIKFAHLGDIGQKELTPYQKSVLASVDVLMIPIGGETTIDAQTAKSFVEELSPKVVVPMHYGNPRFYRFRPLSDFTSLFPDHQIQAEKKPSIRLRLSEMESKPTILVLPPSTKDI